MTEATQTADDEPEITRHDEITLTDAIDQITRLPNTRLMSKSDVWATFRTDSDEVSAVCETAFKNHDVVMWKADREEGRVSVVLEKFEEEL